MKTRRITLQWALASVVLVFALGSGAAAATTPPAASSATSDEATTVLLGDWIGTLDTGADAAKIRLVLHLGKNPDGTLNGSLDSPDEKVKGIPVDKPIFAGGILAPNRVELKGTWYKGEASFPVEFKKQAAPPEPPSAK